jgi:hypothetical protein
VIAKADKIERCRQNVEALLAFHNLSPIQILTAQPDRVTAMAPETFPAEIRQAGGFASWNIVGNHGTTAVRGWREEVASCSLQIIEHSTGVWELDVDLWNPNYGAGVGLWHGLFEVLPNMLRKGKTDPFKVYRGLVKRKVIQA